MWSRADSREVHNGDTTARVGRRRRADGLLVRRAGRIGALGRRARTGRGRLSYGRTGTGRISPVAFVSPQAVLPLTDVALLGLWPSGDFGLGEHQMTSAQQVCATGLPYVLAGDATRVSFEAPLVVRRSFVEFV